MWWPSFSSCASGVPFIAFDNDPVRVKQGREDGFPVHYGDIADPDLLATAHAGRAALLVLTVDGEQVALQAVSHLKNAYPLVPVIATGEGRSRQAAD